MITTHRGFLPLPALILLGLIAVVGGTAAVLAPKGENSAPQAILETDTSLSTSNTDSSTVEANLGTEGAPDFITDAEMEELVRTGQAKPVIMEVTTTGSATDQQGYSEADIAAFNALLEDAYQRAAAMQTQEEQTECLLEPTPTELGTLSPQQQQRIQEVRCGTNTSSSDLNYKLQQQQRYQECVTDQMLSGYDPGPYCDYLKPIF